MQLIKYRQDTYGGVIRGGIIFATSGEQHCTVSNP